MHVDAAAAGDIVSKGEFARRRNVSPGRVSQWISERKIFGEALVGEGREARIRESVAISQLRLKLDIGQRLGNGLSTRLDAPSPPPAPSLLPPQPAAQAPKLAIEPPPADPIEEQIKRERLEQLQRANRKGAEEEALRTGLLMLSDEAAAQMAKIASHLITVFDGALAEFAQAIGAKFEVPQRDVLHLLRQEMRKVRASAATRMQGLVAEMPKLKSVEIAEEPRG